MTGSLGRVSDALAPTTDGSRLGNVLPVRRNRAQHDVPGSHRRLRIARAVISVIMCLLSVTGCGLIGGGAEPPGRVSASIIVRSGAFGPDERIPSRFSCNGANISPPLRWSDIPENAEELALVVDDPDATGGTFVHWVVFGIDPKTKGIATDSVPSGARQARNSNGEAGYTGPCPPEGTHRYRFTVYALSSGIDLPDGAETSDVFDAISPRAIARGRLIGLFGS
jgi:Raf kinase inhibitor-like YbhB/YbcL family protein